ncbi:Poly [ADP-ribose] polymerase [Zootermopsis nevadensis]|uniref:NAD(+) ADP-ribosyltransferase n=1 Tax=Zootermopsis nevadensis TaxID=136037 RepID=A0A067RNF6_ZOONE|nr:Poly [ADP-ribose] polymerase [Zootermopsis nevadensis]
MSWGRIGTTIGGMKLAEVTSLKQALKIFECIYKERTGNEWASRNHFEKVADSFYPVDLDYSQVRFNCYEIAAILILI